MSSNSAIEWTEATWNPIAGCTPVSPGCMHCYAATMSHRLDKMGQAKYAGLTVLHNGVRTFNGKISFDEAALLIPLKRKKPCVYFVNSMSDLFHEAVPFEFVDKVFAVMALTPQHTYQVLTKRPQRMAKYLSTMHARVSVGGGITVEAAKLGDSPAPERTEMYFPLVFPNVWLGTSVENQKTADERIQHLLQCPAAVLFLSCEPLLASIDLLQVRAGSLCPREDHRIDVLRGGTWNLGAGYTSHSDIPGRIGWVIVGGESGAVARPCAVDWVQSVVEQCKAAGVPAFVKQLGSKPVVWTLGQGDEFCPDAPGYCQLGYRGEPLADRKGGDMAEWPEDLRVREMPRAAALV